MSAVAAYAESGGQMRVIFHQLFHPGQPLGVERFLAQSETPGLLAYRLPLQQGEDHFELGMAQSGGSFVVEQGGFTGKPLKSRCVLQPIGQLRAGEIGGGGMDVAQTIRMAHLIKQRLPQPDGRAAAQNQHR